MYPKITAFWFSNMSFIFRKNRISYSSQKAFVRYYGLGNNLPVLCPGFLTERF
jgi:hypothetical protein